MRRREIYLRKFTDGKRERERERGFTRSDQVLVVGRLYSMIKRI